MEQTLSFSKRKVLQGALLVGGTAIGAGMLALPIASAEAGFIPAIGVYSICWLFSLITGLLLLEVALKMPKDANLISMSRRFLGRVGQIVAWCLYLFLFYSLTIAYITGGGNMLGGLLFPQANRIWGMVVFAALFGTIVTIGQRIMHQMNLILMFALIMSYIAFIGFGFDKVHVEYLKRMDFRYAFFALPVVFTTFSYQGVIPSLVSYLGHHRKMLRLSIIIGVTIPFIVYLIWDFLIKGIVPVEGPHGLLQARNEGLDAVTPLQFILPYAPLTKIGRLFAFFAVTTSFLGVTTGLIDFLADGFKCKKTGGKKILLACLVFIPPICIGALDPSIFFIALKYAGGIGCVLLLGMLPTMMVWIGRYVKRELSDQGAQVKGGRWLLFILIIFMIFEVGLTLS